MRAARTNIRGARRLSTVALCGTTALAIIGGSVLSATAANADTLSCLTTNGTTTLVNVTGSGSGLINLGSPGGVIGVATGANGTQIGLLSCTAVVGLGGTAPGTAVATITAGTTPTSPVTVPTATTPTAPAVTTPSTPTSTTPTVTTPTTSAPAPATSSELHSVKVTGSTTTVYPAAKGYSKSRLTFSVKGLTAGQGAVKVTGKAVLKKGTKVVKTWKITSTTKKLSWNGRIGKKVKPGVYTLTVKVRSAGSAYKTTTMKVRVSAKHLVTRTVAVKSKDIASTTAAVLPAKVRAALKLGEVTVRIRTVAHVHGPAKLVFKGKGTSSVVPLKDGTHTTKAVTLHKGLKKVTIGHRWKKGDATLTSLRAIFTYKQLV